MRKYDDTAKGKESERRVGEQLKYYACVSEGSPPAFSEGKLTQTVGGGNDGGSGFQETGSIWTSAVANEGFCLLRKVGTWMNPELESPFQS